MTALSCRDLAKPLFVHGLADKFLTLQSTVKNSASANARFISHIIEGQIRKLFEATREVLFFFYFDILLHGVTSPTRRDLFFSNHTVSCTIILSYLCHARSRSSHVRVLKVAFTISFGNFFYIAQYFILIG